MQSVFSNGGMIGSTLDFRSQGKYITGVQYNRPTFVGAQAFTRAGSTSQTSVTFNLTGGIATSPQQGDVIILTIALGAASISQMVAPALYTSLVNISADSVSDSVLYVGYLVVGSTPPTSFPIPSALSSANSQMVIAHVWRGLDQLNPIDVAPTTATSNYSRLADPPPITPVTTNAVILGIGACAYQGTLENFTNAGDLNYFISVIGSDTYDGCLSIGYHEWTSGTFNPAQFSMATSTSNDSYTSATIALRPAALISYGNFKNSGIWLLQNSMISAGLYRFSTFTFNNGTAVGQGGPSLSGLLSVYDTSNNTWLTNTDFFNVVITGIQEWKVPATAPYSITAAGAAGGGYISDALAGRGAVVTSTVTLNEGHIIQILCGQKGGNGPSGSGGGGGATYIVNKTTQEILVVAGGGGGRSYYEGSATSGDDALFVSTGNTAGTVNGTGGCGGGTYSLDGLSSGYGTPGIAFTNGGFGGAQYGGMGAGGFGGGGGAGFSGAGGGGGYGGGRGGGNAAIYGGGGGGSYTIGTNVTYGHHSPNGYVTITRT